MVGDTFPIDGEMAVPFLYVIPSYDTTVSPEPLDIGGCQTTQNVRNGHIIGVSDIVSYQKSTEFRRITKNRIYDILQLYNTTKATAL